MSISSELIENLEEIITKMMQEMAIPGASIAISLDGKLIYSNGFGSRDLKDNLPATPETLYGFGSNGKSYTALAIMQLARQKMLNLTDPIKKYIPFRLDQNENPITIHHLLSHSSGISALGSGDEILICRLVDLDEYYIPFSSYHDFLTFLNSAKNEVVANPGERFAYFNEGFYILQIIIEKVTGMKYYEYINQNILKPLNMNRSAFLKEDIEKEDNVATPYFTEILNGGKIKMKQTNLPYHHLIHGAGGIVSSVVEQINYLEMYLNQGTYKDQEILDKNSIEQMLSIQIETDLVKTRIGDFGKEGYGYGWVIIEDFFGKKILVHSGNTMVSAATLFFVPELNLGIAMAANNNHASPMLISIPFILITLLLGKDPFSDLPFLALSQHLNKFTGDYQTYKGIHKLSIFEYRGMLYIEVEDRPITFLGLQRGSRIPLIPDKDWIKSKLFYIISGPTTKIKAWFKMKSNGDIDLLLEEWTFHKMREN